jgi:hypothetical protein
MQTLAHRRAIANSLALKQGLPVTQAAIDARWGGIVAKLNKALPSSRPPVGSSGERAAAAGGRKPTRGAIDSMWAGIATGLNREAGLTR